MKKHMIVGKERFYLTF